MAMLKKMHGEAVEGDTLERLAQEKFREAAEELKIEPIGSPVTIEKRRPGSTGTARLNRSFTQVQTLSGNVA